MGRLANLRLRPLLIVLLLWSCSALTPASETGWTSRAEDGSSQVHLHFFWSRRCPHCAEALPFVRELEQRYSWVVLHSAEVSADRENLERYREMAAELGLQARSVPAFIACGEMVVGYDSPQGTGQEIERMVLACRGEASPVPDTEVRVPFLGDIDPESWSLPLFTLVIAGLDAFNPCAFFVLLFLLSLLVHARSRRRMLLIGGTFVFFSGLVYFLFMAAWLNLFLVIGGAPWITGVAGTLALVIGILNTKDFFLFRQGPSLSLSDSAKPGLFRRMRGLLGAERLPALLAGTVALALAANTYELLCTAGFPMVYTRVLTLHQLPPTGYYGYLVFYNLVYVTPLIGIVGLFTLTLGSRKLSERQGRTLKLLSGLMMAGLGVVLLAAPGLLNRLWVGASLLAAAMCATWVLSRLFPEPALVKNKGGGRGSGC